MSNDASNSTTEDHHPIVLASHQRNVDEWIREARKFDSAAQGADREFYAELRRKAFRERKFARREAIRYGL